MPRQHTVILNVPDGVPDDAVERLIEHALRIAQPAAHYGAEQRVTVAEHHRERVVE